MFKQFFKDSAIYGLSTFLAKGVSLLLLPFYTRVLTTTDYGIVDILIIFASLVNVTVALEISQAVARFFSDVQTQEEKIAYASTSLWFTLVAYTVFAIISGIYAVPLASFILDSSEHTLVFQIALLFIWSQGLFTLTANQLRWQLQPKHHMIASLCNTVITISSSIFFVLILQLGVVGVIGGQFVGSMAGAVCAFFFARHNYRFVFDWSKLGVMLKFSAPLVPSSVGVIVSMYIDRIAIKQLMTIGDVGVFGIAFRLASPVTLVMTGFRGALMPLVYNYYRNPGTSADIARIFRYFVALALVVFVCISLFSHTILVLLTTPEYYGAAQVVPLLVLSTFLSQMYIFAPGLGIAKKTSIFAFINIAGAFLNTGLNFVLIPMLGIFGAGLATLISSGIVFIVYMVFSQKYYFVPHAWIKLGIATFLSISVSVLALFIQTSFLGNIFIKIVLIAGVILFFVKIELIEPYLIKYFLQYIKGKLAFRQ
jgi:O-antigen/teichoic acid export membrane protein